MKDRIKISMNKIIKHNVKFVLTNGVRVEEIQENQTYDYIYPKVVMASLLCRRDVIKENGYYDEETRHSGDLEFLDRYYFKTFGEYKYDNFWYFLNDTFYVEKFYYHIMDVLYVIKKGDGNSITDKNNSQKRIKYVNKKREYYKNIMKNNG